MQSEDARLREELASTGELFDGYSSKMEKIHLANAAELEKMIERNGGAWLGKSLVGADGAEAAWLIAQHAVSLPKFSRKCLRLIENAVKTGEAERYQFAYLQDRINFLEGRAQRYGTQSDWNEKGKMQVWTLENEEKVNEFRTEAGLPPLENLIWENEETRENAPKNWQKRQADFLSWAKKVGWRK